MKKSKIKSITKFMEKFKINNGIIVIKDLFKRESINEKEILFLPAWLFLLSI